MTNERYNEIANIIKNSHEECYNNEFLVNGQKRRLFTALTNEHTHAICEYRKGSKIYGNHVPISELMTWDTIVPVNTLVSIRNKQIKNLGKIITMLNKSGLWAEICTELEKLYSLGYDKVYQYCGMTWDERKEFEKEHNLKITFDSLPYTLKKGIKSITYPCNDAKQDVINAMNNKTKVTKCWRKSYDNSFSYCPESNAAWYSEEYKDCGNGHYYLAIDATHAIFCEDD